VTGLTALASVVDRSAAVARNRDSEQLRCRMPGHPGEGERAAEASEVWERLVDAGDRYAPACEEINDALNVRDQAIREASEHGYSRRDVARAAVGS
jgi:hypothetical protein